MQKNRTIIAGAATGLAAALLFDVLLYEKYSIKVNKFRIGSPNGEPALRFIHLTDLHLGGNDFQALDISICVNKQKGDLLLFSGDTVDTIEGLDQLDDFLSHFSGKIPKVFILGNWEYKGRIDLNRFKKIIKNNNGHLLVNDTMKLKIKGTTMNIAGIDDYEEGNSSVEETFKEFNDSNPVLILNHQPVYFPQIDKYIQKNKHIKPLVVLAGHLHGGQIKIPGYAPLLPLQKGHKFVEGWYTGKTCRMYISRGVGTVHLPIRLFSRAEIAVFDYFH